MPMILDNVIEKVSDMCCAQPPKDGSTAPNTTTTTSNKVKKSSKKEDILDEKKDEAEDSKPTTSVPVSTKFTDKETKFEFTKWADLPADAKKAAETLGYDEEKWDSDGEKYPKSEWEPWHKLSDEQKGAAEDLGWDEEAWEQKYEETSFADIPDQVKRAAEFLGFDDKMWDDNGWPETKDKSWKDLSADEKAAYAVFGYTRTTWD